MRRVLVAYDGTESACTALALAVELAKALGADVAVISVIPTHVGWTSTNPCDDDAIHALELCEAQEIVRRSGLEPTLIQRTGDPAETIERVAEEGKYDVIVVGSREPQGPSGRLHGRQRLGTCCGSCPSDRGHRSLTAPDRAPRIPALRFGPFGTSRDIRGGSADRMTSPK